MPVARPVTISHVLQVLLMLTTLNLTLMIMLMALVALILISLTMLIQAGMSLIIVDLPID
jgi:hypothetical protein